MQSVIFESGRGLIAEDGSAVRECRLGDTTLRTNERGDRVTVEKPFMATTGLFARTDGPGRAMFAADLRPLVRPAEKLDPVGVYALLQYAAPVAPWSPYAAIRSFPSGLCVAVDAGLLELGRTPHPQSWEEPVAPAGEAPSADRQADYLEAALDKAVRAALARAGNRRIVCLFSGGADSSLIAHRLSLAARDRTVLFHYSQGADDPETAIARRIADAYGLPIHIVHESPTGLDVLTNAARLYPFPFGDHSAIPTRAVVEAAMAFGGRDCVLFDGTAADGAFGLFGRAGQWDRAHRLGPLAHTGADVAFRWSGSWRRAWKGERALRLLRRVRGISPVAASIGQNPVDGLLYHAAAIDRRRAAESIDRWMEESTSSRDRAVLYAGADLAHICTAVFAQKSRPIVDAAGITIEYPFMDPAVISLSLRRAAGWPDRDRPKGPIYDSLARSLPRDLVYRPKVGFVTSMREAFASPAFLNAFDALLRPDAPLAPFIVPDRVRVLRDLLAAKRPVPVQTERFAWLAVFLNQWLTGCRSSAVNAAGGSSRT